MKSQLIDIVKATTVLPFQIVKVTGSDGSVVIQSRLEDANTGTVFFRGILNDKVPEFDGVFGLNNLGMLAGLTGMEAFTDADAKIYINRRERNGVSIPEEIIFEKAGFGKASYRLMAEKAVPAQAKQVADIEWDVSFSPLKSKIAELTQLSGIYSSQETKFSVKTENRQLKFMIGDENAATHKAQFVIADGVQGTMKPNFTWNINGVLPVLKSSNKAMTMKICNQGILQIEVDGPLGVYTYTFVGAN